MDDVLRGIVNRLNVFDNVEVTSILSTCVLFFVKKKKQSMNNRLTRIEKIILLTNTLFRKWK
jgi:hypothetical protein